MGAGVHGEGEDGVEGSARTIVDHQDLGVRELRPEITDELGQERAGLERGNTNEHRLSS